MNQNKFTDFCQRHGIRMNAIALHFEEIPELMDVEITFALFDCFALGSHRDDDGRLYFLKLTYPRISMVEQGEEYNYRIRKYRCAGEMSYRGAITLDEVAICLGKIHEITIEDFTFALMTGLMQIKQAPKHLHVYRNEGDFLDALAGEVYTIADEKGQIMCDILTSDFVTLTGQNKIYDYNDIDRQFPLQLTGNESDYVLADAAYRDEVYKTRIEIIIF